MDDGLGALPSAWLRFDSVNVQPSASNASMSSFASTDAPFHWSCMV